MAVKTKDITPKQYAEFRGCSLSNITKHIRQNGASNLPHVIRLKNWSRFYLLEVPESLTAATFKENKLIKYNKKGK